MLNSDLFVGITVFLALTILFLLDPSRETFQFAVTMVILYLAILWLKEILEKDGNKTRTV